MLQVLFGQLKYWHRYVQNAFAWEGDAERFSRAFRQLRNFAAEHPEVCEIMAFIDQTR